MYANAMSIRRIQTCCTLGQLTQTFTTQRVLCVGFSLFFTGRIIFIRTRNAPRSIIEPSLAARQFGYLYALTRVSKYYTLLCNLKCYTTYQNTCYTIKVYASFKIFFLNFNSIIFPLSGVQIFFDKQIVHDYKKYFYHTIYKNINK